MYHEAEKAIAGRWQGIKMYRWARRVGDHELAAECVYFDRAPGADLVR